MRCHYTYDKKVGKILIPGCWGSVIYGIEQCTCRNSPTTYKEYERDQYNQKVSELRMEIKDLEKYNASLQRIIKRLIKKE